jgi:hypothetical protein
MSFPSPITSLNLRVTTGVFPSVLTFEQTVPSANLGSNHIQIIDPGLLSAFNNLPPGTIFNPSIDTTYDVGTLPSGYTLSTPSVSIFIPRKIIPTLSLENIPDKLTTDSSFLLSVTTNSDGAISYSSNNTSVATVDSSTGLVTIIGEGTVTITVNQAASADGVYAATLVSNQFEVSAPMISTIVAFYPFDSTGDDNSINGNHLTIFNSVTYNTIDYKQGNGAASFNGNNYFERANDGRFSPDNFTVACWIKPVNRAGNYQSIATCRRGFSPDLSGWMIYIAPDNNLQFWTGNTSGWSGGNQNLFSGFGNLNRWVHIAFTFTKASGLLVVYIDGSSTTTVSRSYINTTNNSLRIGAGATEQSAQFFLRDGTLLDDFRFYNGVLSASEVSSIVSDSL